MEPELDPPVDPDRCSALSLHVPPRPRCVPAHRAPLGEAERAHLVSEPLPAAVEGWRVDRSNGLGAGSPRLARRSLRHRRQAVVAVLAEVGVAGGASLAPKMLRRLDRAQAVAAEESHSPHPHAKRPTPSAESTNLRVIQPSPGQRVKHPRLSRTGSARLREHGRARALGMSGTRVGTGVLRPDTSGCSRTTRLPRTAFGDLAVPVPGSP